MGRSEILIPVLAAAAVISMMVVQSMTPEVTVADAPDCRLYDIDGFKSETLKPSEAELNVLPKDTVIEKRRYVSRAGDWFQVTLVIGGKTKSSIHRPELCLPAQGFIMENSRSLEAAGIDWRVITLSSRYFPPTSFAYTFFNQEGFRTDSHVARIIRDMVDRSVFNRIDRWVMVTVTASRVDDIALEAFLAELEEVVK